MNADSKAVFLSYASQDAEAARRICEALRAAGVEVWFDQSELRGGDAWDAKIRKQIKECALFVPIISANTQARLEGYFRLEWRLADQRTHLMGKTRAFLLPVCIDDTSEGDADVPESFLAVQWTRPRPANHGGPARPGLNDAALVQRVMTLLDKTGLSSPPATVTRPEAPRPTPCQPKSVAVLPFVNLSRDPENEYFSDGISEELLNVLAKVPGLRVAARTSSFYFKGRNVPVPEIAQKLGVAHVVEGSVRKAGNRVRITAQLIAAADGFHLWSDTFDRELQDIFAVQDEIAGLIAQKLRLSFDSGARAGQTVDPEAHRLVLEARSLWARRTEEGFAGAEYACLRALEVDPDFAPAHACLADVYVVRDWYSLLRGHAETPNLRRGMIEAERALKSDPHLAEPHAAIGAALYNLGRLTEAEESFHRAYALNPNYATAYHWHAHVLATLGRSAEATAALEHSLSLDPFASSTLVIYAQHLIYQQRHAQALIACDRVLALKSGLDLPAHAYRALALLAAGRNEEAVAAARVVTGDSGRQPRWFSDIDAVYALRKAGRYEEAVRHVQQAQEIWAKSFIRGFLLAALDRFDEAFPIIEDVTTAGRWRLFYSPIFDAVRDEPRFARLIEKLNCVEDYQRARASLGDVSPARVGPYLAPDA